MDGEPLLEVRGLTVSFDTEEGPVQAVRDVSFSVRRGGVLCIVGESGCGKSVSCHALLRLLPDNARVAGEALFKGRDLLKLSGRELNAVRGAQIAMIFQDPAASLNPVHTVGGQIAETLRLHRGMTVGEARAEALRLLDRVGIPGARRRLSEYPHQLSGGMNQRVMIAMALACRPALLIADEPTTALDVTIQAQILNLLRDLQEEYGMGLVLVTHDLGVVAEMADDVAVMYAGRVVEQSRSGPLFRAPAHPYSVGLLESLPRIDRTAAELSPIEGSVPPPFDLPAGCAFGPRCRYAAARCQEEAPVLHSQAERAVACFFPR